MTAAVPKTFSSLSLARYVAALWVVAYHLQPIARESEPVRHVIGTGFVACSFFFVLSGFVLARSGRGASRFDAPRTRAFVAARLVRIGPAYLLALAALVIVMASRDLLGRDTSSETPGAFVRNALLVQAWDPRYATTWNFPGWSVSVELAFYLVFPLLAPALARARPRSGLALVATLWALPLVADLSWDATSPGRALEIWHRFLEYHPLARLPELAMGVWLARAFSVHVSARGGAIAITSILVTALSIALLGDRPYPFTHTLYAPLFALTIYGLACWDARRRPSRVDRFFDVLGDASYPLYIFQVPVALALDALRPGSFRRWLLCLAVLHAVALFVSLAIERPLRRWWRSRTSAP